MQNHWRRHKLKSILLTSIILCSAFQLSGCPVKLAFLMATHEPMHPTNGQAVTFEARAWGSVERVVLAYERYELSTGPDGGHRQTLVESMTTVETCDPPETVSSLTCEHTMDASFPAHSLISFHATVVGEGGSTSASESYKFAAGDYPWPDDPIPVRTKGDPQEKFDIVFIPDTDITVADFRDELDEVVEDLYFEYEVIKAGRGFFNFYYSGEQGDYEETCLFTNPPNMANLSAIGDAIAFLHATQNVRDCKSGNRMSSEIDYDKSLIHESGHALFGLQDEYCCDSSYSPQACYANLWDSLEDCQAAAASISYPDTNCTQLSKDGVTLPYWRICPTGSDGCMMGPSQHNPDSDFGKACSRRIYWRYGQCMEGNCFPFPECP